MVHAIRLWGGLADYVYSLYGIPEGAERDVARHEVHLHSANRLQDLCFKNGGIYIKLGQHIGQLVCLLRVSELWKNFSDLLVHGLISRSCCPLWGADKEVSEDLMVEMVTTLLLLKISQHVCHYGCCFFTSQFFFLPLSMCSLGLPVCFDMLITSKCLLGSYWDHLLIIFRLSHFVNHGETFCTYEDRFQQICVSVAFFSLTNCAGSLLQYFTQYFFSLLPFLFILSRTTWCQRSM